ncbi:MAG: hypothetical protein ABIS03_07885 [Gemmatimonadaceae bacterium]
MSRKTIGFIVILIWVTGLILLTRRGGHETIDQHLAEIGLRVSPETFYYTLRQGDMIVGVGSSAIDTSNTRVIATDMVRGRFPVGPDTLRVEAKSEARFTRGMRLRDFVIEATGDLSPFLVRGVMQEGEEKLLRITTEAAGEKPITVDAPADLSVFVPTVAPLPLMLQRKPKVGDSVSLAIFDPTSRALRNIVLRIESDSLFLIADSAAFDSTSRRWVKAHQDSVRGWRITRHDAPLTTWVDAGGRLLAASEPGGVSLVRTTFELAFGNWRVDNPASPPVSRQAAPRRRR